MKFLCENCKAKYQIADEKVAGRSVRMKCRKCGHLIEIRSSVTETSATLVFSANLLRAGASDAPVSVAPPVTHGVSESPTRASAVAVAPLSARPSVPRPAPRETRQPSRAPEGGATTGTVVHGGLASAFQQAVVAEAKAASEPAPATGGEWFVGIGGSPVGPIGVDELRTRAAAGAVQEDSLVWREGFSEWVPLSSVPELRDIARLVRPERSPLSSRAGALVGRLGIGPRSSRPPSGTGGQVVPLVPRSEVGKGTVPPGGVHETLAISPGAMPLVLPGLVGRAGSPTSTPPATKGPSAPATSTPAPSAAPPSPAAPAPAPSPFGAPNMGGPVMGGMANPMGAPMGNPMGAPMGNPMGAPMGNPMGAPGMGGPMGMPGMGAPGFGMGSQPPAPIQQQVMPFQQPFGMGMAPPPGFGMPPPVGFPVGASPGFAPVVSTPPPRRKGGIPLAGWAAIAAALGTGVLVGAMWVNSGKPETKVEDETAGSSDSAANTDTAGSTGSADSTAGAAGETAGAGGSGSAEAAGSAGSGSAEAAGAAGSESAGAAGSGSESAGAAGSGSESAGAAGSADSAAGAPSGEGTAGTGAVAAATPPVSKPSGGGRRPGGGGRPKGPVAVDIPPPPPPVQTVASLTTPGGPPAGPVNKPASGGGSGALSNDQVQGVVNNGRMAIRRACWDPALAAKGGGAEQTRVTVSITIGPDGKVQQSTASGGDGFPSLGPCIASRVRSWIFPSSGGVTQTTATFKFIVQ